MPLYHKFDAPNSANLTDIDPKGLDMDKAEVRERTEKLGKELNELQDLMFYAGQHSLLLVLQGMDTAGKDGAIRHIFSILHGQAASVASFKVPTPEEMAHDFLWRCHKQTPGRGEMRIFNRSHYEDVLVVRVHEFVPKEVWSARYEHINNFEQVVATADTIIVKVFLHITKGEQEERLIAREQEAEKAWKLSVGDWKEREHWDDYQAAYQDVIRKCSTEQAPWYVVPANKKSQRDLAITEILVNTLRPLASEWKEKLVKIGVEAKEELGAYRASLPKS